MQYSIRDFDNMFCLQNNGWTAWGRIKGANKKKEIDPSYIFNSLEEAKTILALWKKNLPDWSSDKEIVTLDSLGRARKLI